MFEVKVMKAFGYTICYYSLVIDMHGFACNIFQISWLFERSNVLINPLIVSLTHKFKSPKVYRLYVKTRASSLSPHIAWR
jgi:hypothetical protein